MPGFDLHCHSTRSDGLLTPVQLVARAAGRGVETLAITDHDELGGLREGRACAREAGIAFIDGVEISVTWNGQTLHVVGLAIDPENPDLVNGLEQVRSGRRSRAESIARQLEQAGISGSLEGARSYVTNPELVGRTHFARYLVERGCARDVQSVFRKYLASGKPGYVPHRWASLEQAVNWIKASGGMAVLAHPARYHLDPAQCDTLLKEFKELRGAGVEVVTGSHTAEQFATWGQHAKRFGLLASTGSDFHGPGESRRDLGELPELPPGCTPIWKKF